MILNVLGWSWAALRVVLKHFEASWGDLGGLLEPLGGPLGGSWGLMGTFWAALEVAKTSQKQDAKKRSTSRPLNVESPSSLGGALGGQNQSKMLHKTNQNSRRFSRAKKLLFKSLLEPSWADLGAFWRPSWEPNMRSGISGRSIW